MKQNAAPEKPEEGSVKPVAVQLREAFDEVQTLKADRDALVAEIGTHKANLQTAIARIVLLESDGKLGSVMPGQKNRDGSFTLSITLSPDIVPSLHAQYEGMGQVGVTFEEYLRDQVILPSVEAYQGAF